MEVSAPVVWFGLLTVVVVVVVVVVGCCGCFTPTLLTSALDDRSSTSSGREKCKNFAPQVFFIQDVFS